MKILDRYILKSFIVPFLATFFIILFVLVMQALWLAFESIAGKGISMFFILKFLYYTSLIVSAQALPIAVLLSSIMAMGNLAENYEFAAAKSASISLMRLIRPLIFLTLVLSVFNFFFLNNIYPYAVLKQKNLMLNIRKKKPALALVPGSFNTEIPDYQIKFDEKYGEEDNYLKKVLIYDLSSGRGNKKVITAKDGKILTEEGSKYMTFVLYDGYYYEEHSKKIRNINEKDKMPASSAFFEEYIFNIDISAFSEDDLEEEKFKNSYNMLSIGQLRDTIPDIKQDYDQFVYSKSKSIYNKVVANELYSAPDSITKRKLEPEIFDNFDINGKVNVVNAAINSVKSSRNNAESYNKTMKIKRKRLNLYDVEYYNRMAFSLSCLVLFFIGAPLGSIIRKGGFGLPMILAISIYVIYFFANTFGRNLAEESSLSAIVGAWISSVIMIPFALILSKRASKGMALFSVPSLSSIFTKKDTTVTKPLLTEEEVVVITEQDQLIEEKLRPFSDRKLIDIIKNYRQYSYTKGEREVGLQLLAERGITKEELKLKGQFENHEHIEALRNFNLFDKSSRKGLIIFSIAFVLNLAFLIFTKNFNSSPIIDITGLVLIQALLPLIAWVYVMTSIFQYARMSKALNKKLEIGTWIVLWIGGLALYFILYFYIRNDAREKIKAIR